MRGPAVIEFVYKAGSRDLPGGNEMLNKPDFATARDILLEYAQPVGTENIQLCGSAGRLLAQEIRAAADVPGFDRSPYDGYAFRAQDVAGASAFEPVTLSVVDHIAAGDVPHEFISLGTAARIMTGAPVPEGADAIVPYESTKFTDTEVQIFAAAGEGQNIVRRGEDVKEGQLLAQPGIRIDDGLAGTMAAQGIFEPVVYRKPVIGIISTGDELIDEGESLSPGKIFNTNRYSLQAACADLGCGSVYLGLVKDSAEEIAKLIAEGAGEQHRCDAIVLSGGVSAGDIDLTPDAMKMAGAQILIRGLNFKPGMAGAYGIMEKPGAGSPAKLPVMALSGNPAACMTAFRLVCAPVLKKLAGWSDPYPEEVDCELLADFPKASRGMRILRGRKVYRDGKVYFDFSPRQGNAVLSTVSGNDMLAVIPAGSGPLRSGTVLKGYLV